MMLELDWTEGLEKIPVYSNPKCVIKQKTAKYVTKSIPGPGTDLDEFQASIKGCECVVQDCNSTISTCSCVSKYGRAYNDRGHLISTFLTSSAISPVFECNVNCACTKSCGNRVVQNGVLTNLQIFHSEERGLCLRSLQSISRGQFVCQYAGEIISYAEARARTKRQSENDMNYILVVSEHCASGRVQTIVDPTVYGNIGRYINHSCSPNLIMVPVRIDSVIPTVALFACRDIEANEELTFDYGSQETSESAEVHSNEKEIDSTLLLKKCYCGSEMCKGFLPFVPSLFK